MTDDTKGKEKTTPPASNSILSLDALGMKPSDNTSLASFQTIAQSRTPDRGLAFGVIKGTGSALSHLVTDPIAMASQPMTTLQGLGNVQGMAHEMVTSAKTALTSGNQERLGSFLGATAINVGLIGAAFRGTHGAVAGTAEARPFSQAAKFEGEVAARTQMLRSVEPTPVLKPTSEGLADAALKSRAQTTLGMPEFGNIMAHADDGAGSLVNKVLGREHVSVPREIGTTPNFTSKPLTELPELKVGPQASEFRIGEPPRTGGVTVSGTVDDLGKLGTHPTTAGEGLLGRPRTANEPHVVVNEPTVKIGGEPPVKLGGEPHVVPAERIGLTERVGVPEKVGLGESVGGRVTAGESTNLGSVVNRDVAPVGQTFTRIFDDAGTAGRRVIGDADQLGVMGRNVVSHVDDAGGVLGRQVINHGDDAAGLGQRLATHGDDFRPISRTTIEPPRMAEFKSSTGTRIEGFELEGVRVQEGRVISNGRTLPESQVLADGRVMTEGRVIGQVDDAGRVIVTRETGALRIGEPGSGFKFVESQPAVVTETVPPRTRTFVGEPEFVSARTEAVRTLDDLKASGVEPVKVETFQRALDDYALRPNNQTFTALKQEWRELQTQAKTVGVSEAKIAELQTTVERAIGTETAVGTRATTTTSANFAAVEKPSTSGVLSERPAAVNEPPKVVFESRPVVSEQPVMRTNTTTPPIEQPTWRATQERIVNQLDDVRTTVRESGGNPQIVSKLDDAVANYAKQPTKANLDQLNTAFREVEQTGTTIRGGKLTEQLSEVRQNVMQHMPPEHAAITRIETLATRTESGAISASTAKVTENIAQSAEKMRGATTIDDFVRESRAMEKNVTKYLTEEVRAGRMTAQDALDVQRATRTFQQEAQATTTVALREQGTVLKFNREPVVERPVVEGKTGPVVEKPVVEGKTTTGPVVEKPVVAEAKTTTGPVVEKPVVESKTAPVEANRTVINERTNVGEVRTSTTGQPLERPTVVEAKVTEPKPVVETKSVVEPKTTFEVRRELADQHLGPKATEYHARIESAKQSFVKLSEATDDAARIKATTEFRQQASQVNNIIKETGLPKPIAEQLTIDVRGSLQQARIGRVATELERITIANNEFVATANRAIREANIPEPVRTQLRAQVHTFESHVNGLTATETQWGTRAGTKALDKQVVEMERSFKEARIDFTPFRERVNNIESGLETYRTARQASSVGDNFFTPARQWALEHPIVGKSVDFLWNNPTMLKAYMAIGVAEISKGLVTAAEYGRAAEAKEKSAADGTKAVTTEAKAAETQPAETRTRTTDGAGVQPADRRVETNTGSNVGTVAGGTTYVARERERVTDATTTPVVSKQTVADASAGTTQNKQNIAENQRAAAAQVSQDQSIAQRVGDKNAGTGTPVVADTRNAAVVGTNTSVSQAFFSVPLTAQELRAENRRKYGGLDVGFVYYAKGPGYVPPVEESRPIQMANSMTTLFSNNISDIPERERPANVRFDWKRTRLDASALAKPDGFHMSTPYGADGRGGLVRGAGAAKRDENAGGAFARRYAFLAGAAEQAKSLGNQNMQADAEAAEAINPDNAMSAQGTTATAGATTYNNDPTVAAAAPLPQQDDEQSVALT